MEGEREGGREGGKTRRRTKPKSIDTREGGREGGKDRLALQAPHDKLLDERLVAMEGEREGGREERHEEGETHKIKREGGREG